MSTKHFCLKIISLLSTIKLSLIFSLYNTQKINNPSVFAMNAIYVYINLQRVFLSKIFKIKNITTFEDKVQGLSLNKYSKLHNVTKYPKEGKKKKKKKKKKQYLPHIHFFSIHGHLQYGCYHMLECPNHKIHQKRVTQTKPAKHWQASGNLQGELRCFIPFLSASSARLALPALRFCLYHFANQ